MGIGQGEGTGLNPHQAREDIANFQSEFFGAANKCADGVVNLMDGLAINWASPNAVEFAKGYEDKIIDTFFSHPTDVCNEIVDRAEAAFNSISTSQGGPALGGVPRMGIGAGGFTLYEEIGGDVGMNIENVKGLISTFETEIEAGLNAYDALPTTIAFYDPSGSMAASYQTKIKALAQEIAEMSKALVTSIQTAIEGEQNNTNLGKEGAVEAFDGSTEDMYGDRVEGYNPDAPGNMTPPYNPNGTEGAGQAHGGSSGSNGQGGGWGAGGDGPNGGYSVHGSYGSGGSGSGNNGGGSGSAPGGRK